MRDEGWSSGNGWVAGVWNVDVLVIRHTAIWSPYVLYRLSRTRGLIRVVGIGRQAQMGRFVGTCSFLPPPTSQVDRKWKSERCLDTMCLTSWITSGLSESKGFNRKENIHQKKLRRTCNGLKTGSEQIRWHKKPPAFPARQIL